MLTPKHQTKHLLTIEISRELYRDLQTHSQATGNSESDLVTQGLQQILKQAKSALNGVREKDDDDGNDDGDRFDKLAINLEQRLKSYVEELVKEGLRQHISPDFSQSEAPENSRPMPLPTIRPLQIGDRVLVLEPDSPYYMAKVLIVKTSLIRATVATETGEHSFLKRDLRFVEATNS